MKVKYGHEIVEVWQISHEAPQETWVRQLFDSGQFQWRNNKTYIQAVGGVIFYGLVIGYVGDYLLKGDSYRVVDKKTFEKECQLLQ